MASSRLGRVNVLKTKIEQLKIEQNISKEHIDSILGKIDSSLAKLGNEKNFKKLFLPTNRLTDQLNRILLELNLQLEELKDDDSEENMNDVPVTPTKSTPRAPQPTTVDAMYQSPGRERAVSQSSRKDISKDHTNREKEVSKSSRRVLSKDHTNRKKEVSEPQRVDSVYKSNDNEKEVYQQPKADSFYKSNNNEKEVYQQPKADSIYKSPQKEIEVSNLCRREISTYHNLKSSEENNTDIGHRKVLEYLNYEPKIIKRVSNQKMALAMGSPEFTPSKFELEYKSNKEKSSDTECEDIESLPRYRNTPNDKIGEDVRYQSVNASYSGFRVHRTHNLENSRPVNDKPVCHHENQANTHNVKPILDEPDYKQRNQGQNLNINHENLKPVSHHENQANTHNVKPILEELEYKQRNQEHNLNIKPVYYEPDYKKQNHEINRNAQPVIDEADYSQEYQAKTHKIKPVHDEPENKQQNQTNNHNVKSADDALNYKQQNDIVKFLHSEPDSKQDNLYLKRTKINAEVVKKILDSVSDSNRNQSILEHYQSDRNRSDYKQEKKLHSNDVLEADKLKHNQEDGKNLKQRNWEGNSYYSDEEPERLVQSQSVVKLPLNDELQKDEVLVAEGDTCIITHVNSPSCFYILIATETIEDYDRFHEQLQNYCESENSEKIESKEELKCVNYVCCYNEIDYGYKWFRCVVTSLMLGADGDANKVQVMAVDDGFEIQIELSKLRKYPKLDLTLPHMAIKCSLLNIAPPTESKQKEWPINSIGFFDGIVRNSREKPFTITAVTKNKDIYEIDLINNMESNDLTICKVMIHMEFARTCSPPVTNPDATTDDLIITSDFMKEQILQAQNYHSDGDWENLDDCETNLDVAVCNQMEGGYTPKDFGRLCRFTTIEGQACFKGDECQLEHRLPDPDGWTRDQIPVYTECINRPLLPEPGTKIKIIVTYVKSITSFYGHLKTNKAEKNSLIVSTPNGFSKYINKEDVISKLKKLRMLPALGQLVLAKSPIDQKWYRGRVHSIHSEDQIDVFFIDYGDMGIVSFNDLREIELQHLSLPEQAIACHLNLQANSHYTFDQNQNAVRFLSNLILDTTLIAVVKSNGFALQLDQVYTKKKLNLCDHLLKLGLASMRDPALEINYNSNYRPD